MDKNKEREPEIQKKADLKVLPRGWTELAAGVKTRAEAVVEEVAPEKVEPLKPKVSKKERQLHKRMREERESELQGQSADPKVVPPGWTEVVARVKARAEAPLPLTVEAVVEEVVPEKEEPRKPRVSKKERELHERMIAAGRYMRERDKERVWGIDRKIYHRIVVAVDKRADNHIDRSVGDMKKHHRRRIPVDKRARRGPRFFAGVHPFRPMPSWRH